MTDSRPTTHDSHRLRFILTMLAAAAVLAAGCGPPVDRESAATSGTPVLVGIGASDAVGIGASDPERDNWVAQLGARLPSGSRVVNLGISGADIAVATQQELPVALDVSPTLVVVWLGVNDFSEGMPLSMFTESLASMLHDLRAAGHARVFVGNLPDLRLLPAFRARDQQALATAVAQWNSVIAQMSHAAGATLVDIYAGWSELRDHPEYISGDGLHPTSAGYRRLADLFWQAIRSSQPSALTSPPAPLQLRRRGESLELSDTLHSRALGKCCPSNADRRLAIGVEGGIWSGAKPFDFVSCKVSPSPALPIARLSPSPATLERGPGGEAA